MPGWPRNRRGWWGACALVLLTIGPASSFAADDAEADLKQWLDSLTTWQARFIQTVVNGTGETVEQSEGAVYLRKPGRFRWNYETPYQRQIVADGERLYLYEEDLDQVTIRPLDAGLGATPAALLSGNVDVLDRFDIVAQKTGQAIAWVELRPKADDSDFDAVRLGFAGGQLAELELDDRLGQSTRIAFSAMAAGQPIGAAIFQFSIPDGADVIGEGEF